MSDNSSCELLEFLENGDIDKINQAVTSSIEHGCKETATTIKTKVFHSSYGPAKELWEKYIIPKNQTYLCFSSTPPANYVEHMRNASGVQYTVSNIAPLIYASNLNSIDRTILESSVNLYSSRISAMKSQYYEVINVSVGWCSVIHNYLVYSGTRTIYPPIYQSTQLSNNTLALKAFLRNNKNVTESKLISIFGNSNENEEDSSSIFRFDPTERPKQYKLKKISINEKEMKNLGGPEFEGYHKMKFTNIPETATVPTYRGALLRDQSFAALEIDKKKTTILEDSIPDWRTLECVWEEDNTVSLPMPLESAYQAGNETAIQLLLQDTVVCATTTLYLRDTHHKHLALTLKSMNNLTSLKLESTGGGSSVPECVFLLKNLRHLDLRGSDYMHIPDTVAELTDLEVLNVSGLPLDVLPVIALGKLRKLNSVDCTGIKLASPPPEIVKQGHVAVAQYILALGEGAELNTDVLLMLIGDGEAGKTSLLQALKNNATNCAGVIGVDDRTVGIDISSFQPHPEKPLKFFAWDFGGQGIYAIMQQLFVSRRALYPLLWRVRQSLDVKSIDPMLRCDVCKKYLTARPGDNQQPVYRVKGQGLCHSQCVSYEPLISSWTERLQFRVPGVSMVLIATHIDCATPAEVEEQCAAVTRVVERLQARQALTMDGIAPVKFCNNGQSLRVNNMTGEGIPELRQKLIEIAQGLDFYGEVIPASYVRLRQKLREMQRKGDPTWRTWLLYKEYAAIAKDCGLSDATALQLATQFLHDVGELRYFAHSDTKSKDKAIPSQKSVHDTDDQDELCSSDDEEPVLEQSEMIDSTSSTEKDTSSLLLSNTVFPNPFWIVDVLRGLIRHDHSTVLGMIKQDSELSNKERRTLRRRVYRLMQRGFLHESLLKYVWRGVAGMSDSTTTNTDEFARLIALMKAFDILMDKPGETFGSEWIVPTLAAGKHSHTVENDAFIDDSLPFVVRLVYDALPPYFDMMLVAHVINRRIADSVDFIGGAAAFHKLAEKAVLFAGLGKVRHPDSVFRRDQLCEERLRKVLRDDQCHVVIAASSRQLMLQLMEEVSSMNAFFPGLCRLCALFPCYSCRMKRIQLKQSTELFNPPVQTIAVDNTSTVLPLSSTVSSGAQLLEDAEQIDILSQEYLRPALQADAMNCGAYYIHNQEILQPVLQKYKDLHTILGLEKDESVAVKFNQESVFVKVFGKETPRLFQEVLMVLISLKSILAPTAEDGLIVSTVVVNEAPTKELSDCLRAVEERQYNIAFQQAGAELPTLRTITKYCSKHVDALFIAWEICPELEVLCMSLNSALEESAEGERSRKGLMASELSREEAAPEYMHLLRSTVELVYRQQRPQSPCKANYTAAEACKELLTERALDIAFIREEFPALLEFEQTTLASLYGGSANIEAQAAQYHLLLAVLQCYDSALSAADDNLLSLEDDKKAISDLRDLVLEELDVPTIQLWMKTWIGHTMVRLDRATTEGLMDRDFEVYREKIEVQRFIQQLEAALTALHLRNADTALQEFTRLDSTFNILSYNTIKEAFAAYTLQHQLELTLVSEVCMVASDGDIKLFVELFPPNEQVVDNQNISNEFIKAIEKAQYSLSLWILALFRKAIQQAYHKDNTLSQTFEKLNVEFNNLKNITYTDLDELWFCNKPLIQYLRTKLEDFDALFPESEDQLEMEFCLNPQKFQLQDCYTKSTKIMFHHISLAYHILQDIIYKLENFNIVYKNITELNAKIYDWEKLYPVSSKSLDMDILREIYDALLEDPCVHMIGLKLAFNHRDIAFYLLEAFSCLEDQDFPMDGYIEVIRTLEYLKANRDLKTLPDIIKERIDNHRQLKTYFETCETLNETNMNIFDELNLFIEEEIKKRTEISTYRTNIAKIVFDEFNPWLEIEKTIKSLSKDRDNCIKTYLNDWKTREQCRHHVYEFKCTLIDEQKLNLQNIISSAKEEGMKWKESRLNTAATLKDSELRTELFDLVKQSKLGIDTYNQLRSCREHITNHKIEELIKLTKERLSAYHQLMCLRDSYGPPWYFGAGRREAVPRVHIYSALSDNCLAKEMWKDDSKDFINFSYEGVNRCICPGEAAALTDPILSVCAQPAQSCAVYISHNKRTQKFADKLALAMEETGLNRNSIRTDPDKFPVLLVGDIVTFHPTGGSLIDSTEHQLLTGLVVELNERTYEITVRSIDPSYRNIYRGLRPVSYQINVRRSEHNRHLIAVTEAVAEMDFQYRDARGCIVPVNTVIHDIPTSCMYVSLPGGERSVKKTELKLGEASYLENSGALSTDDLLLFHLLKHLPGYPVLVRIDGTDVLGTVAEEPVRVSYKTASGGSITEVFCDRRRVIMPAHSDAVAEAKVMLCLINAAYADSEQCRLEFWRAQAHGLGVIPIILSDYEITNYQQWWPKQLPSMAKHSLFVDMRSVSVTTPDMGFLRRLCATQLGQTLRVLLSEFKGADDQNPQAPIDVNLGSTSSTLQSPAGSVGKGPQFVYCEACAMDGAAGGAAVTGKFDRWHCQSLVGEWTAQELARREQHPDTPAVCACPVTVRCSGEGAHELAVRDVLAVKAKKSSYPCPHCLTKGVLPPYCFDREACLAELEYNKGGAIMCKRCHGSTPLHELLVCEVFLSYCWGPVICPDCTASTSIWESHTLPRSGQCHRCSNVWAGDKFWFKTQRLVLEVKGSVEPEAGVMCWQDVDRLVGGKDLEREMEVGVKHADVVVIFLDDGYVRSANCRKEYLHTTKHGKYVIPVLLQGYRPDNRPKPGEQWWPDSMSSLSQFEPIELTEASQMEAVLFEICERIQSRFHRAQRFPTADDAIAYLRDYSSWGLARRAFLSEAHSLQQKDAVDDHLSQAFVRIDKDGNNQIDESELSAFLDEHHLCLSSEQIGALMREADIDQNGLLSMEELKLAVFTLLEEQEQELQRAAIGEVD